MNFNIELSEWDVDRILEVWRHDIPDSFCRKISDQIRAQIPSPLTIGDKISIGFHQEVTFLAFDTAFTDKRLYFLTSEGAVEWVHVIPDQVFETPGGGRKVVKL